jgi:hypothetical protein
LDWAGAAFQREMPNEKNSIIGDYRIKPPGLRTDTYPIRTLNYIPDELQNISNVGASGQCGVTSWLVRLGMAAVDAPSEEALSVICPGDFRCRTSTFVGWTLRVRGATVYFTTGPRIYSPRSVPARGANVMRIWHLCYAALGIAVARWVFKRQSIMADPVHRLRSSGLL